MVNVGFGGKIRHRVNLPDQRAHKLMIPDVASHESVPFLVAQVPDVVQVPGVRELVRVDHFAARGVKQVADEVASYEPCPASDENSVHVVTQRFSLFRRILGQQLCGFAIEFKSDSIEDGSARKLLDSLHQPVRKTHGQPLQMLSLGGSMIFHTLKLLSEELTLRSSML